MMRLGVRDDLQRLRAAYCVSLFAVREAATELELDIAALEVDGVRIGTRQLSQVSTDVSDAVDLLIGVQRRLFDLPADCPTTRTPQLQRISAAIADLALRHVAHRWPRLDVPECAVAALVLIEVGEWMDRVGAR